MKVIFVILIICGLIILYYIYAKQEKQKRYRKMSIKKIDKLTGIEFEELLQAYYKKLGYSNVKLTKKTSDYGADIIMYRNGKKYVLQAKRYSSKVGVKAIQEVLGAKCMYNADCMIVATNNYFTKNAWELAKKSKVYLIDRNKLLQIHEELNPNN